PARSGTASACAAFAGRPMSRPAIDPLSIAHEPILGGYVLCPSAQMNVFIHFHFQLFYVLDPLVLYGVWQATENIVAILHTPRNHRINPFVLRVVIHEIEHVNIRTHLAKSLNPPKALFKARRIP